jgi:hypothetical protein
VAGIFAGVEFSGEEERAGDLSNVAGFEHGIWQNDGVREGKAVV